MLDDEITEVRASVFILGKMDDVIVGLENTMFSMIGKDDR